MKANELMIGDWVTFKDAVEDNYILPVKIVGIGYQYEGGEDECLVQIGSSESCDIIDIDDEIVGIPLTAEILEKNGFIGIMGGNGIEYTSEEFKLRVIYRINNEGWTIYANHFGFDKKDLYVHKLQHALRLCGIEKEITI